MKQIISLRYICTTYMAIKGKFLKLVKKKQKKDKAKTDFIVPKG